MTSAPAPKGRQKLGAYNICRPFGAEDNDGLALFQGLTPLAIDYRPFGTETRIAALR